MAGAKAGMLKAVRTLASTLFALIIFRMLLRVNLNARLEWHESVLQSKPSIPMFFAAQTRQ
jgi:hypothetical protein